MAQWIPWMKEYEIEVKEIDDQHQELFRMFNELMDAVWDGKGKDAVKDLLEFTANYAVNHFSTEEKLMQQFEYPDFSVHKKLHDDFVDGVIKFVQGYESNGASPEMVVSVITDLGNWTREHIRATDQELGKFLIAAQEVK